MISCVLVVLPYYFLYKVLNALLLENSSYDALRYAIIILLLIGTRIIVYVASLLFTHIIAFRIESNMKKRGIEHLLNSSFSFFDMNESGRVRKIIDDNTGQTHMIVAHLIPDLTAGLLTPILLIATIFVVNIRLGFFMLAITIIGFIIVMFMFGNKEFMQQYLKALDEMNSETVEYVRNIQVVKIFNTGVSSFNKLYEKIISYSKLAYSYTLSCKYPYVLFQVVFMLFTAFTIPFAVKYLENNVNPNYIIVNVVFFATFAGMIFHFFLKIMFVGMYKTQASEAVDKLENLMQEMKKNDLSYGNIDKMEAFNIEFENVNFGYSDDKKVLENTDFSLEQGKTYALVGASGSGKSTIAKLISGFYKINSGSIKIGNRDITEYTKDTLRDNIAFVFQNSKLFKTSIFENVKIGKKDASYEEVMNALELAKCNDILDKFDKRENTVIGAKGVHLSGGEIQRIAIARTILKNANIIILDEASAAADPENEYEIQQAFKNLMKDKTVIMIAHRLSSIRNVDEILVIENGKVIERGSDKELMTTETRYHNLQNLYRQANEWRIV